jgi:hypothetical protein
MPKHAARLFLRVCLYGDDIQLVTTAETQGSGVYIDRRRSFLALICRPPPPMYISFSAVRLYSEQMRKSVVYSSEDVSAERVFLPGSSIGIR